MPTGYAACAPSLLIQITSSAGGVLFAVLIPGVVELVLVAPAEPVPLGSPWVCGWSAWGWLAPLNRADAVAVRRDAVPVAPQGVAVAGRAAGRHRRAGAARAPGEYPVQRGDPAPA